MSSPAPGTTGKLCPILTSGLTLDTTSVLDSSHQIPCQTTNCMFYNTTTNNCGANNLEMYNLDFHIHNQHKHVYPHQAQNINFTPYGYFMDTMPMVIPKASVLLSEYSMSQDLDNNGLIYGYDFIISDSSASEKPQKPTALSAMEQDPDFPPTPALQMTWAAYMISASSYPAFDHISPNTGTVAGDTTVYIYGTGFTSDVVALFDTTRSALSNHYTDTTSMWCLSPVDTSGAKDVALKQFGGMITASGVYTYV